MTPADYRELAEYILAGLAEMPDEQLRNMADPAVWMVRDEPMGERRMPEPREWVIAMLETLDRHLALLDPSVAEQALETIRKVTGGGSLTVEGIPELPGQENIPKLRERLQHLIAVIRMDAPENGGPLEGGKEIALPEIKRVLGAAGADAEHDQDHDAREQAQGRIRNLIEQLK